MLFRAVLLLAFYVPCSHSGDLIPYRPKASPNVTVQIGSAAIHKFPRADQAARRRQVSERLAEVLGAPLPAGLAQALTASLAPLADDRLATALDGYAKAFRLGLAPYDQLGLQLDVEQAHAFALELVGRRSNAQIDLELANYQTMFEALVNVNHILASLDQKETKDLATLSAEARLSAHIAKDEAITSAHHAPWSERRVAVLSELKRIHGGDHLLRLAGPYAAQVAFRTTRVSEIPNLLSAYEVAFAFGRRAVARGGLGLDPEAAHRRAVELTHDQPTNCSGDF